MVLALEGAHRGNTIFVIGSGPGLGSYSADILEKVGRRVCIGVNRTQYLVKLTYFMSSYLSENLLAKVVDPQVYAIHTRPVLEPPMVSGINTIKRVYSEDSSLFRSNFDPTNPCLYTRDNVIFLATNMALIMGAKNIVYVGCEQRNGLHFYNTNDEILNRIIIDMCKVITEYGPNLGRDHSYEFPLRIMRSLTTNAETLRSSPFYTIDHSKLLREWLDRLALEFAVKVYSCSQDSVITDAGAEFIELEQALDTLG